MPQSNIRNSLVLFTLAVVSTITAVAQATTSIEPGVIQARNSSWQVAQAGAGSMHKLTLVTIDHPDRRQTCRVQSFTPEKLVCSRVIGRPRTYLPQGVLALIVPGDDALRLRLLIGLNAALGASIWGTVVLAATCPACAVGAGVAAFVFFAAAGAISFGDGQPDRVLYLAAGHRLSNRFRYVEDWR